MQSAILQIEYAVLLLWCHIFHIIYNLITYGYCNSIFPILSVFNTFLFPWKYKFKAPETVSVPLNIHN